MASSDNISPPSVPIPTPRSIKPVPVPRSRTKVAPIEIVPENDIMQRISFTSPLQEPDISLDLRNSIPERRVILSESQDNTSPKNRQYENVIIKTTPSPPLNNLRPSFPPVFHVPLLDPPNIPPPPVPDMSNYDQAPPLRSKSTAPPNTPPPLLPDMSNYDQAPPLKSRSTAPPNTPPPLLPDMSNYDQAPPLKSRSTAPPNTPPPFLPDMSNYDQAPPFKSMSPPHIPPPPLPDESTYDQPRSLSIHRSLSENKNEYFTESDLMSTPVKQEKFDDDDYLDPTLLRPKNKVTPPKKTTESVLLHFDPLYENIFINTSTQYGGHLDDIFKPSDQEKRDIKAFNGENASSLNRVETIAEEINENSEDANNWEDFVIIGGKTNKPSTAKQEDNAFGYDIPEHIERPDHSTAFNMNNTTGYGKINKVKKSTLVPVVEDEGTIPKPPVRMDSIPREDMSKLESPGISNYLDPNPPPVLRPQIISEDIIQEKKSNKLGRFKSIKGFTNFTKNILQKPNTNAMSMLLSSKPMGRPEFGEVDTTIGYTGVLVQPGRDRTEWGVTLANGTLKWASEKGEHELSLQYLTSIAAFTPAATPTNSQSPPLHCIELASISERGVHQMQIFATALARQRATWLQRILEASTSAFPHHLTKEYTRAGWLHIKEGVSGSWVPCWLMLRQRELYYCAQLGSILEADLRKARCIAPQESGGLQENAGSVLVELHGRSLYLQALHERDTNRWGHCIKAAALNNGVTLTTQQLTKDNVPVIVEKCANFVAQQGSVSEGIYRRSGVNSTISKLLSEFSKDAWSVQLTRTKYSEHEVATALKRFFKDLPEPLISAELTPQLCKITSKNANYSEDEKVSRYRLLLQQLQPINYVTSRKLFGHLHFIHLESKKNLMTARNLAAIWGISLMHQQPADMLGEGQTKVVTDLIALYPRVYDVTDTEMAREMKMLSFFEKYHSAAPSQQPISKPSGDLRIWISIGQPGSGETVQIAVGPLMTAGQLCAELDRGSDHMLQEFVLGGALARPMHPTERVLDTVVRWGYWDIQDRKDNELVLAPCALYEDIKPLAKPPLVAYSELKFADNRSKNFKTCVFELNQAKLSYYKDKKYTTKVNEWKIEDIVWYLGYEPKRDPVSKWSITFINRQSKPNRSRDHPFFGCTMAGSSHDEMLTWCAAMFLAEYPEGL